MNTGVAVGGVLKGPELLGFEKKRARTGPVEMGCAGTSQLTFTEFEFCPV